MSFTYVLPDIEDLLAAVRTRLLLTNLMHFCPVLLEKFVALKMSPTDGALSLPVGQAKLQLVRTRNESVIVT
jgi:hypothetical protein